MTPATLVSCTATETSTRRVTERENGQTVYLRVGDRLQVDLEARPSTGYKWVATKLPTLLIERSNSESPGEQRPGSSRVQSVVYEAIAAGSGGVVFSYLRPWEKKLPLRQIRFEISIK